MWNILIALLTWLGLIKKPAFVTRYAESHPSVEELAPSDLVVVRSGAFTKWACLRCPCGCGDKIALSLDADRRPSWRVSVDWLRRPSLSPSVWRHGGCHSHFWIKSGAVEWCLRTEEARIEAR
jgi:hypothetical protein